MRRPMEICTDIRLASDSRHKTEATRTGFNTVLPLKNFNITATPIQPEGNAQAEGDREIIAQALDRLAKLKAESVGKTRDSIFIAIQSGIISVEVEGETRWLDVSWVVMQKGDGKLYVGHSSGVEFSSEDVLEARKRGFKEHTVGSVQAERWQGDPTDPHSISTAGAVSREETIQIAVESVLGQMMYDLGIPPAPENIEGNGVERPIFESFSEINLPVLVASKSEQKVQPTQAARDHVFPGAKGEVEGVGGISSGVNEQPWGNEETSRGALNRLECLDPAPPNALTVAIENGVLPIEIQGEERYFDFAWVVAKNSAGKSYLARSSGVEFAKKHVDIAKEKGFETTTIGSVIESDLTSKGVKMDGADPHSTLTNFMVSRRRTLEHAGRIIFGQIRRDREQNATIF